ncbi:MAG: rod shape-determining protein MreC [Lachnospiraceae bacterium]
MSPVLKRPNEKITIPSKYLLFFYTILCIGVMVVSFQSNIITSVLSNVMGSVVVPFQKGIATVGGYLTIKTEQLAELSAVLEENQNLQEQVDSLLIENTQLQQERYELTRLRELFELSNAYPEYKKTGARIIGKDATNWYSSFTIDKGSDDGIMLDCNVMAGSGLVGIVTYVGKNYSKVTSIINDNINTSGMILSTNDNLIVSGDLETMKQGIIPFTRLVDSSNQVNVGDKIVTSNVSDKYLPNILIGYISSIQTDSNNLTKSGTLTLAVDFEHLEQVLVLLELKQDLKENQ